MSNPEKPDNKIDRIEPELIEQAIADIGKNTERQSTKYLEELEKSPDERRKGIYAMYLDAAQIKVNTNNIGNPENAILIETAWNTLINDISQEKVPAEKIAEFGPNWVKQKTVDHIKQHLDPKSELDSEYPLKTRTETLDLKTYITTTDKFADFIRETIQVVATEDMTEPDNKKCVLEITKQVEDLAARTYALQNFGLKNEQEMETKRAKILGMPEPEFRQKAAISPEQVEDFYTGKNNQKLP